MKIVCLEEWHYLLGIQIGAFQEIQKMNAVGSLSLKHKAISLIIKILYETNRITLN